MIAANVKDGDGCADGCLFVYDDGGDGYKGGAHSDSGCGYGWFGDGGYGCGDGSGDGVSHGPLVAVLL